MYLLLGFVLLAVGGMLLSWFLEDGVFINRVSAAMAEHLPSLRPKECSTLPWASLTYPPQEAFFNGPLQLPSMVRVRPCKSGCMMVHPTGRTIMGVMFYQYHAKLFFNDYILGDPSVPYTSIIGGVLLCKMIYDLTQLSAFWYYKDYSGLTKVQRVEWGNTVAMYLVFFSDMFSVSDGLLVFQSSSNSTFALGISVGYFISDLGMIIWSYPSLGGMEYLLHHLLSVVAVTYSMLSHEGQIYTLMVLISELTTPFVNLRWYLHTAGMKRSRLYVLNGILLFFSSLVARILLFGYIYHHVYLHYDQVEQMLPFGFGLVFAVPFALAIMNIMWFGKILKGLMKTLAKRQ